MTAPQETKTPHPCPHHSPRPKPIQAIVLHDTASNNALGTLAWFSNPSSKVSAHVVIDRDGRIYRVVPDDRAAWHAGVSTLHGVDNLNAWSLGVELVDHDDDPMAHPYAAAQIAAAAEWCAVKSRQYKIPLNRIVGHDQICVPRGRKVDPGRDFDWRGFLLRVAWHQL